MWIQDLKHGNFNNIMRDNYVLKNDYEKLNLDTMSMMICQDLNDGFFVLT